MAGFKTHVTIGSFVGFFLTIGTYVWGWTSNFAMAIIVFFTTVIGSFLPDMDSDSGLPIQIIFGLYSFFGAGIAFYFLYNSSLPPVYSAIIPLLIFLIILYAIKPAFKKVTSHRGAFHSLPAFFISFFFTLLIVDFFKISIIEKFIIALSISLGYLSHLILDEVYASNLLTGKTKRRGRKKKPTFLGFIKERFRPNRAFGTAIDLALKPAKIGLLVYAMLGILIYLTFPLCEDILKELQADKKLFFEAPSRIIDRF